jgi:hypothetical protein
MPKDTGPKDESIAALVDSYELEIDCRLCGWRGQRMVGWLNARRDMHCPRCRAVIVLNTSERQRRIAALRRQVAALREQLCGSLESAEDALSGTHPARADAPGEPASKLELWQLYGGGPRRPQSERRPTRTRR